MADYLREALTASNVAPLIQKYIDPLLLEYERRYSPLVAAIPTKQIGTNSYYYNKRTVLPNGGFITDGGAQTVSTSTYTQTNFDIKLLQTVGSVTGYAQAVSRDLIGDLREREISGAIQAMLWNIETGVLWGNATSTASGSYPEFDGLDYQVSDFTSSDAGYNAKDEANATLALAMLDDAIDIVEENASMPIGTDWMFVMSPKMLSKTAALQVSQQRFNDTVEVATGLNVMSYRDVPIIKSSFLANRGKQMSVSSFGVSSTGGTVVSSTTTYYQVSVVIQNYGEYAASTVSSCVTASSGSTNCNTLGFATPASLEGGGPLTYKVYSGSASSSLTLLGVVDAYDNGGTATTTIIDTGTALLTNTAAKTTVSSAYSNKNAGAVAPSTTDESIYLIPRNEDFLVRPFVRNITTVDLYPTTSAPDTLPFGLVTDTTLATRGPKYVSRLARVKSS